LGTRGIVLISLDITTGHQIHQILIQWIT